MTTYDARPSAFTQMTTTSEWETFCSAANIYDGVDTSNSFVPSLDTAGRNAVMSAGDCLIKGMLWRADASVSTPIPAAESQDRIDYLVLQLNRAATSSPAVIQPIVVKGTAAATPVPPTLTQNSTGIFQIPISQWTAHSTGVLDTMYDARLYTQRTPRKIANIGSHIANSTNYYSVHQSVYIPPLDAAAGAVVHKFRVAGNGTQATGTAVQMNWQLAYQGNTITAVGDNGNIPAGVGFNWLYDGEFMIFPDGSAMSLSTMVQSRSINTPSTAQSTKTQSQTFAAGYINVAQGGSIALQIGWASTTGSPLATGLGFIYEKQQVSV